MLSKEAVKILNKIICIAPETESYVHCAVYEINNQIIKLYDEIHRLKGELSQSDLVVECEREKCDEL